MAPKITPEFAFLLRREKVAEDVVNKLAEAGVLDVRTFANLVDDVIGLRAMAKEDLKMSPDSMGDKVKIASLICAWKTAHARAVEIDKMDAQAEVQDLPKQVLTNDHESLRTIFDEKCWALEISDVPGKTPHREDAEHDRKEKPQGRIFG